MNVHGIPNHASLLSSRPAATPDLAPIQRRDGTVKPVPGDRAASPSATIQQRLDLLNAKSATLDDLANQPLLTMEGFQAEYGKTDSAYDLNADGIVDYKDMWELGKHGGTMHHADAPITIDGFEAAYGTANASYDLTADGLVDFRDMQQFHLNAIPNTGDAPVINDTKAAVLNDTLIKGESDPIAVKPPVVTAEPIDNPQLVKDESLEVAKPRVRTAIELRNFADAIRERLEGAGFRDRPPIDLHALLDRFELMRSQKNAVLERLAERYPRGLGVNRVG